MNSPSSMSQRVYEAAWRAAEVLRSSTHNNICTDGLACSLAPQFLFPDVVSCGHFSPDLCVDHSYSGSISTLSSFLFSLPWKPAPSVGIRSAVEEYKCLQGLALSLWPRPLVESWPWDLTSLGEKKKKKKTRKKEKKSCG